MASPPLPPTMKAWLYTRVHTTLPAALTLNPTAALPTASTPLSPTESLIKVHFASLNPIDYKLPEMPISIFLPKPGIPGIDFSGVVAARGSASTLEVGQRVCGKIEPGTRRGTLADYVIVGKEGAVPVPDGVDMAEAACLGVCGLVTYQSLKSVGVGDVVFVNGGSGGTGTFAVQIAKARGAVVDASCSATNKDLLTSLGATTVVDYRAAPLHKSLESLSTKYTLFLDNIGSPLSLYWSSPAFTAPSASYIQIGAFDGLKGVLDVLRRYLPLPTWLGGGPRPFRYAVASTNAADLRELLGMLERKELRAVIEEKIPFEEVPAAFERLRAGRTKGKLVIVVNE